MTTEMVLELPQIAVVPTVDPTVPSTLDTQFAIALRRARTEARSSDPLTCGAEFNSAL